MYIVFKEMQPQKTHPTEGGYICLFDSVYGFEVNAIARVKQINEEPGAYAYYEQTMLSDETIDGMRTVATVTCLPRG